MTKRKYFKLEVLGHLFLDEHNHPNQEYLKRRYKWEGLKRNFFILITCELTLRLVLDTAF
jgi:hypothetical protein